jgi:hypothetical protein
LVINSFSPFRRQISDLAIFDVSRFTALSFEPKLPTTVSVPNLDVLCEGSTVVAIESKCIEYLRPEADAEGKVPFKPAYEALEHLLDDKFGALYEIINRDFGAFAPVNVTQIVKHYLGIKSSVYRDRPIILGYLFWEPADHDEYPVVAHHRNQLAAVSDLQRGSTGSSGSSGK